MFGGVIKRPSCVDDADNNRNSAVGGQTCRTTSRYGNNRASPYVNKRRLPEGEPQSMATESEGERQLRRLLEQQLDTTLSLAQQMQRHRSFQSSSTYETITKGLTGQISSSDYQKLDEKKQKVDDLKDMGLNDSEVALKLDKVNTNSNYGKEPSILRQQLMAIQDQMDNKNRDLSKIGTPREAKQLTRHEMDIERSIKPTCQQSKLLQALTTTRKYPDYSNHSSDPVNHLKSMELQLMERVNNSVKMEKKKRSMSHCRLNQILDEKVAVAMDALLLLGSDLIGSPNFAGHNVSGNDILYTKDGLRTNGCPTDVRHISDIQPTISDEDIVNNRLREEQIRGMTRFKCYTPGKPTRVLYLKNLANNVEEKDLRAIFCRFERVNTQPLEYKLMKGRMRGQAFITFPGMEVAVEALQFVNGFLWKGKPIIIEFSREG
ncbi:RNA binding motif protein 41 [Chamberlinius hualienensis]